MVMRRHIRSSTSASPGLSKTTREALDLFTNLLRGKRFARSHALFEQALVFIQRPGIHSLPENEKEGLSKVVQDCFDISDAELLRLLSNVQIDESIGSLDFDSKSKSEAHRIEEELWTLLPRGGYLESYARYTEGSEAPLAYHVFSSLVAVGLIVNRKCWFDMGYYRLYPPLAVFLLGPSGLRKTSAANIMLKMVQDIEITKVFPEKLTPEVLVGAVKDNPQGLLYAPEMASTLGKQKYMEHIIPLLTRLLDCPDSYLAETIGRGKELLEHVAISILMCSTPDWFMSNTPADTFGGGFIARNIMVMQNDTPREEDIPNPRRPELREDLVVRLIDIGRTIKGPLVMDEQARTFHKQWYHEHRMKTKNPEHPLLGTYYQRKPDHMKRIAMCIQLVEHGSMSLTLDSLLQAIRLLDWTEQFIPPMLNGMFRTQAGAAHEYILGMMRNNGGMVRHSELVRKVQHQMNSQQLRAVMGSLKEAEQVMEIANSLQHVYILKKAE